MKIQKTKSSSRNQIGIKEVKDGVLVLSGNKYRKIIETSSINFELKSDTEQDAITESFQNFLNSLPAPVQIIVRIRELEIENYLENFVKINGGSQVFQKQIGDYSVFIKKLVSGNKIMSRKFYIVVSLKYSVQDFVTARDTLKLNTDIITKGLERFGMKSKTLSSLEILNLFYSTYNPSKIKTQPLTNSSLNEIFNNEYTN